ncbi:MAG TPA: TadE/TadG family type IV pilus assembly protein [Iamia sp.]
MIPWRRPPRRGATSPAESGQATVELALALPAVLLALLAIVQAGLVVADHVRTVHLAREAARVVAVDGRAGAAPAAVAAAGGEDCTAAVSRPAEAGATLVVRVSCPSRTDVPLIGVLVPDVEVLGRASMRVER